MGCDKRKAKCKEKIFVKASFHIVKAVVEVKKNNNRWQGTKLCHNYSAEIQELDYFLAAQKWKCFG